MAAEAHNVSSRLWGWLAHVTNPTGLFLYGRFAWERRLGAWLLSWWGRTFMYTKPWRPWRFDDS